ncbi:MAG: M28 family peptidase [Acidobacteriota bacterium]
MRRLLLLLLCSAVAVIAVLAPGWGTIPVDPPSDQFSVHRAWVHLEAIAREPRPSGSPAHGATLAYLLRELEGLGLSPQVQEAMETIAFRGGWRVARVRNVLARIPGERPDDPVALVAHYDSVPNSPGAGDDGSGTAVLLESARALLADEPPPRDVLLVFTDAEESGLFGARAFQRHPWAQDLGAVVNLEARGTGGPGMMFETSVGNRHLIQALRDATPRILAASYSVEVYRRMPNDTDFSVFRDRGAAGLNFAFIHSGVSYHSARDSLARLSRRSVQDLGDAALGLARRLGDPPTGGWRGADDAVYFNLLGSRWLVAYPVAWAEPLAILAFFGTLALLGVGPRRGAGGRRGALAWGLAQLGFIATVAVIFAYAAGSLFPHHDYELLGMSSHSLVLLCTCLTVIALGLLFHRRLGENRARPASMAALLVWAGSSLWVAAELPGASSLLTLPLLAAIPAAALARRAKADDPDAHRDRPFWICCALVAVVTIALWAPVLSLLGVALGRIAVPIASTVILLALGGPLAPVLGALAPVTARLPAVLAGIALVTLLGVHGLTGHGPDDPVPSRLFYVLDGEAETAGWYGDDASPWSASLLGDNPTTTTLPWAQRRWELLRGDAPIADLRPAEVEVLGDRADSDGRRLDLRVRWSFAAEAAVLILECDQGLRRVTVDGQPLDGVDQNRVRVSFVAPRPEGIELGVEIPADGSLRLESVGQLYRLPNLGEGAYPPRPASTIPTRGWLSDSTFVRGVFELTTGP